MNILNIINGVIEIAKEQGYIKEHIRGTTFIEDIEEIELDNLRESAKLYQEKLDKVKPIIEKKIEEKERLGINNLYDSDIMDILEECRNQNIPVTRKDLIIFGIE